MVIYFFNVVRAEEVVGGGVEVGELEDVDVDSNAVVVGLCVLVDEVGEVELVRMVVVIEVLENAASACASGLTSNSLRSEVVEAVLNRASQRSLASVTSSSSLLECSVERLSF
jgi:hypothetical protein